MVKSCTGVPTGFATVSGDCNDNDATVNPGVIEFCNSTVDLNCDGFVNNGAALPPVLAGSTVAGNQVTLSWTGECAGRYRVQLQRQGTTNWRYINVAGNKTSTVVKNLTPGTYTWTVRAQTSVNAPYTTPVAVVETFTILP
jgi:hypothetical protein